MEIQPDFKEQFALLNAHNVNYVIVGELMVMYQSISLAVKNSLPTKKPWEEKKTWRI